VQHIQQEGNLKERIEEKIAVTKDEAARKNKESSEQESDAQVS
jgi:pseudo-response regulator 5